LGFKAIHFSAVKAEEVKEPGFEWVRVRWLITKDDGAKNFAMRLFEIEPGGQSAHHSHGWEHEAFILEGQCLVKCGDEERLAGEGCVVFIPPNAPHSFRNTGNRSLRFLCIVPYEE